jgi:hypothetical protein
VKDLLCKAIEFYSSIGCEVVPCKVWIDSTTGKKKVSIPDWKDKRYSPEEAISLVDGKNAIALFTGTRSGIWCLDVDTSAEVNGFDTLKNAGIQFLEDTPVQATQSGGKHYLFSMSGRLETDTTARKKLGLDARGEGGLIFVSPTRVSGGGDYRFIVKINADRSNLREPPPELINLLWPKQDKAAVPVAPKRDPQDLTPAQVQWFESCIEKCQYANKGTRSEADFNLCCTAIKLSFDKEYVWSIVGRFPSFEEKGRRYFELTWSKAEGEVPYSDRREYQNVRYQQSPESTQTENSSEKKLIVRAGDQISETEKLYSQGYQKGESTGWTALDRLLTIVPGQLNVVTGIPSHGKSEFVDNIAVNLSVSSGWRWVYFSPENWPIEIHVQKLSEKIIGKPFFGTGRMSIYELKSASEFIHDKFHFVNAVEEEVSIDDILLEAEKLKLTTGLEGLIFDPWNELEYCRSSKQSETDFIGETLKRLRKFARKHSLSTWVVAHPAKPQKDKNGNYPVPNLYDISGSAHWYNKADNGIVIHRDFELDQTQVIVQKVKFRYYGKPGVVIMRYDKSSGRFVDSSGF